MDHPQSQSMNHVGAQEAPHRHTADLAGRRRGADFGPDRDRRRPDAAPGLLRPGPTIGVDAEIDEK